MKHKELYSMLCGDLNGKEIQKRGDNTYTCSRFTLHAVEASASSHLGLTLRKASAFAILKSRGETKTRRVILPDCSHPL